MTNAQIIFNARCELMEAGKLQGTGRKIEVEDENGAKIILDEPQEMHTFQAWKSLGYQVKKGEKAIAKLSIWKYTEKKKKEEERTGNPLEDESISNMFMKTAAFFSEAQVEPIKA